MGSGYRVLVTCDLGPEALERFSRQPGFSVVVQDIRDPQTLAAAVPGYHALVVRSNVRVTEEALAAGTELRVIGRAGIGVDNIDLEAATRLGIAVVNAPGGNVVTTAEHALALLLSLARKIPQASAAMREGRWEKTKFLGRELRGKTLGIIGVGRVGSAVAERAAGLRMRVLGYDPYLPAERAARLGVEPVGLDRLLAEADFLTVHTGLTPETRGLLGRDALARVKPGVLLVNCARGGIVDEGALVEALEAGRVGGAALDVFEVEPPPRGPLHDRDDVILTPHLGASTVEAQASVGAEVADNVVSFLTTGTAPNALNVPPASPEALRRLGPYLDLARRMGLFLAQVLEGPPETARVLCRGTVAEEGGELVTASFLAGLLTPVLSHRVNAVSAPALARERGLRVVTSTTEETEDFTDLLAVEISGSWGRRVLEGTLFGRREPRIVRFDEYRLDALPRGTVLLLSNDDVPGVIGDIGLCLGRNAINIAGMYNGRTVAGGRAITLVNVDQPASDPVLQELRALPHLRSVRQLFL